MLWAVLLAFMIGPLASGLAKIGNGGEPSAVAFGMWMVPLGWVVQVVGRQAEALAFSVKQRPWLGGRLRPWQKLILPYNSGPVLATAISSLMVGGTCLFSLPPHWSALNVFGIGFVALGGLLLGFGLARLVAGFAIIYRSGLWGPSRRAWRAGGYLVAAASVAHAAYSVHAILRIVPGL